MHSKYPRAFWEIRQKAKKRFYSSLEKPAKASFALGLTLSADGSVNALEQCTEMCSVNS
jgi:hypothetical protein